jgi:hypothetical protein
VVKFGVSVVAVGRYGDLSFRTHGVAPAAVVVRGLYCILVFMLRSGQVGSRASQAMDGYEERGMSDFDVG